MSEERRLTRRSFVAAGALGSLALAAPARAGRARYAGELHVLGLDLLEPMRRQAEKDLGLKLVFEAVDPATLVARATADPGSFDVLSCYADRYDAVWPSGALQPIPIARIPRWRQVDPLFKLGKVRPGDPAATYGQGDSAARSTYVNLGGPGPYRVSREKPPGVTGARNPIVEWLDEATGRGRGPEPSHVVGVPSSFGLDSLGYNRDALQLAPADVSWAQLLNKRWAHRVALQHDARPGIQDLATAIEAAGLYRFADKGDLTRKEIDRVLAIALRYRKSKHFRFWSTFNESVNLVSSKEVVIQPMGPRAVALLQAQQFPLAFASPPEGMRAWAGSNAISSRVRDPDKLRACLEYCNWWLDGWAGASLLRYGYYTPVLATARKKLDPGEYAFWVLGRPSDREYPGPLGDVSVNRRQVRDGGSYEARASRIATWTSYFREADYAASRWAELVA